MSNPNRTNSKTDNALDGVVVGVHPCQRSESELSRYCGFDTTFGDYLDAIHIPGACAYARSCSKVYGQQHRRISFNCSSAASPRPASAGKKVIHIQEMNSVMLPRNVPFVVQMELKELGLQTVAQRSVFMMELHTAMRNELSVHRSSNYEHSSAATPNSGAQKILVDSEEEARANTQIKETIKPTPTETETREKRRLIAAPTPKLRGTQLKQELELALSEEEKGDRAEIKYRHHKYPCDRAGQAL